MPDKSPLEQILDAFETQGFVRLEPDSFSTEWVEKAKPLADEEVRKSEPSKPGWHNLQLKLPMPRHEVLMRVMDELLAQKLSIPQSAQLSTLANGFDKSERRHHCHVDGYDRKDEEDQGTLAWHALLIGVLIVNLPDRDGLGNPVVWPGSHRLTRRTLSAIKSDATSRSVGDAIWNAPASSQSMQHLRLHGPAGTIFVMDHDIHHGMIPHTDPDFLRHIAYYRVPDTATDKVHYIVDRDHFFRSRSR